MSIYGAHWHEPVWSLCTSMNTYVNFQLDRTKMSAVATESKKPTIRLLAKYENACDTALHLMQKIPMHSRTNVKA